MDGTNWRRLAWVMLVVSAGTAARGADDWIKLTTSEGFEAWKPPHAAWVHATSIRPDPSNPKRLAFEPGPGEIIVNGLEGKTRNIVTKRAFGDVEAHFEFLIPKGSNSGVKFEGLYEIQIADSFGAKAPKASDCGGIYPRAELLPKYHYLDAGIPPRVNACKAPGDWQTLDVTFRAPRFDASGKKTENARIVRAVLNGQVIHEDVELKTPTGHAWHDRESPTGPILLQADHGPVAFRNLRVRSLDGSTTSP